jgi:hypothetical protein
MTPAPFRSVSIQHISPFPAGCESQTPFSPATPRAHAKMSMKIEAAIPIKRFAASYDQRRTTTALGATTTRLGATTGRRTTAAPPATQPARYTPTAQTTALASIVLKVMKPPNSNREMMACFIALLLQVGTEVTNTLAAPIWPCLPIYLLYVGGICVCLDNASPIHRFRSLRDRYGICLRLRKALANMLLDAVLRRRRRDRGFVGRFAEYFREIASLSS